MNRRKLKMKDLKKYIIAIVVTIGLLFPCQMDAQIFLDDEDETNRIALDDWDLNGGFVVPYEGGDIDQYVPAGSGLVVLMGLGGAYLLSKRRKDQED